MNTALGNFFHWLLRASWQAAVLVLLILALQWAFGKKLGARWRHALWFLVLVRLALPFSPASAFSLFNLAPPDRVVPAPAPAVVPVAVAPAPVRPMPILPADAPSARPSGPLDLEHYEFAQTLPSPVTAKAQPEKTSSNWLHHVSFPLLCGYLWAAGVVFLLARIIGQNVIFLRGLCSARLIGDGETLALFGRCQAVLGVRGKIRLAETAQVKSPALCGLVRPRLLLPAGMLARFSPDELRHIFLHELAHVKRRDMAVHWAVTAFQVLHWFNPVLWFGFRRLAADREVACDELALAHAGDRTSRSYGETIIKLLELCTQPATAPGVLGILEDKNQMTRRIAMIAGFKRHSRWSLPALALLVVLGVACLTDARPRVNSAKAAGAMADKSLRQTNYTNTEHHAWGRVDISAGSILMRRDEGKALIKEMTMKTYDHNGRLQWVLETPEDVVEANLGRNGSSADLKLHTGDELFSASGTGFSWTAKDSLLVISNHVRVTFFTGPRNNIRALPPVEVTADRSEFALKDENAPRLITFTGNVRMSMAGSMVEGDRLDLFFEGTNAVQSFANGMSKDLVDPNPWGNPHISRVETNGKRAYSVNSNANFPVKVAMATSRPPSGDEFISWRDDPAKGFSVEAAEQIRAGQLLKFKKAKIETFDSGGGSKIILEAPELVFDKNTGEMSSAGFVKLSVGSGSFTITGAGFHSQTNQASYVFSNMVNAVINTSGGTNSKPPGPTDIFAKSCELTLGIDGKPDSIVFSGNVLINPADGWAAKGDSFQTEIDGKSPAQRASGGSAALTPKPAPIAKDDGFIRGTVLQPDGKPAANAQVALKKLGKPLYLRSGRLAGYQNDTTVETDAAGYFSLPMDSNADALFIVHEAGYARIPVKDLTRVYAYILGADGSTEGTPRAGVDMAHRDPWGNPYTVTIESKDPYKPQAYGSIEGNIKSRDPYKLQAYGSIEGTMRVGSRPVTNQTVRLFDFNRPAHEDLTFDAGEFNATTDNQGRFTINHVPPGERSIGRVTSEGNGSFRTEYAANVLVKPGEVTQVVIDGSDRTLTGKLTLNRPEVKVDWTQAHVLLYTHPPADLDDGRFPGSWIDADRANRRSFRVAVAVDGAFRIENVPSTDYVLSAEITGDTGQPRSMNGPPPFNTIASVVQDIAMLPMNVGSKDKPLDLGTINLIAYHKPTVGEPATPFGTTTVDGQPLKLADYRGKYVLLDLEQYLPGQQRPFMEAVSKAWAGDDRLVIITLFPDVGVNAAKAPVPAGGHWIQGDLGNSAKTRWLKDYDAYWDFVSWGSFGGGGSGGSGWITSLPAIFLIGPDGKFLAVNLSGDDIGKAVTKALGKPR